MGILLFRRNCMNLLLRSSYRSCLLIAIAAAVLGFGCAKKVTPPPPPKQEAPPPPPPPKEPSLRELWDRDVRDAYFDYDKADIREDARPALSSTADFLKAHPSVKATIEGHCDERGSTEYNLGLGDRRAAAV